jgi:penicillin-binding protein 1C
VPALHPPAFRAPHFVDWVVAELPPEVRARGGVVRTSLDLALQEALERRVADHVAGLSRKNLDQAGVVVLDTQTGAVRAMVGSADFFEVGGQLNIATRRRHPGSALKPFVYALAIEGGDSPASIAYDILDVPSEYRAAKATQPEHGPVRYREALAGSYNLAAVHVLEKVGVEKLVTVLRGAGLEVDGSPADYGLRMALGSVRVRLVDLAAAYGFLARAGQVTRPRAIVAVVAGGGAVWRPPAPIERRLFSPVTSYLVMDMLADGDARHPVFGRELPVDDMGFAVAAKTGTSRGFSDTVAVAVTRERTVAAWAGNFDGTPMQGLVAMKSAAPLVRAGMMLAADGRELTLPERPDGIVEADVCALSGLVPSAGCVHHKRELFAAGHAPDRTCDWHRDGHIIYPAAAARWAHRRNFLLPISDGVSGDPVTSSNY